MGSTARTMLGAYVVMCLVSSLLFLLGAEAAPTGAVLGIDFGSDNCVVAIARRKGVDIVVNEASQRSTPSIVSFGHQQRFLGEAGNTQRMTNPKNTVVGLKALVGGRMKSPQFQKDFVSQSLVETVEGEDGLACVKVKLVDKERTFNQPQVVSMLLSNLKKIAAMDHESEVKDCVIGVPVDFTEEQRNVIRDAAELAGLSCLSLINENTATALVYGITKTELPEEKPLKVVFVDCGLTSMQVSVVNFKKGELKVLSHTSERFFGGKDVDELLFQHFAEEFKTKYKVDARTDAKASLRLRIQVEKLKKTLSANPGDLDTPINVECMMQDTDVSGFLNRIQLEEMCEKHGLLGKMKETCERALKLAGCETGDVDVIEIVGGTSRMPCVRENLQAFFGKSVTQTLNAAESVARGASLACAMRSPAFKVREFKVVDWNPFPMHLKYTSEDKKTEGTVEIERGMEMPSTKKIDVKTKSPLTLRWEYAETDALPELTPTLVAEQHVPLKELNKQKGDGVVKIQAGLDLSGCVTVESCIIEKEVEVPVEAPKPKPKAQPVNASAANGTEEGVPPAEGDVTMSEPEKEAPPQFRKVLRQEHTDVVPKVFLGMSPKVMEKKKEEEYNMALQDRVVTETNEARNKLEEYVYVLREALETRYKDFVEPDVCGKILKKLEETEEWIYGEGEDAQKSVFVTKLTELQADGGPVERRAKEWEMVPEAEAALRTEILRFRELASSKDKALEHISGEDRGKVVAECDAATQWLDETMRQTKLSAKTQNMPVTSENVHDRRHELINICKPLMSREKPKPPPPASPADKGAAKKEEAKPQEDADSKGNANPEQPAGPDAEEELPEAPQVEEQNPEPQFTGGDEEMD